MWSLRRSLVLGAPLLIMAAALPACGSTDSSAQGAVQGTSVTRTVTEAKTVGSASLAILIPGEDRFSPFSATVAPNGTITITNKDTDEHTVTNIPGAAVTFDVHVKGGESKTLTLPAGAFRYYCTIHAKYVPETDQVAALPSAGFPDQPMEGVINVG